MTPPNTQQPKAFEKYEDHEQKEQPTLEVEDIVDSTGKLINQQPAYDQIIICWLLVDELASRVNNVFNFKCWLFFLFMI